jgi:outer membrane receptor protein involved in Fe transport
LLCDDPMMRRDAKWLIRAALASSLWGLPARAEEPGSETTATAKAPAGLSDADILKMSEETVVLFAERPDKPFDRDTEIRLTGEQLAARGITDLGGALALLTDVSVRDAGRGGLNIDIRGARKGAVSIFIDGVLVSDPYYGTFDVSSIPVTDIVQIRVSTTPQSPIDGPGGPGGVIEVHTRDAIGSQVVVARITGDSLPSFGMSGTARAALTKHTALRIAASGLMGARDLEAPMTAVTLNEGRRAATGSTRLEYRKGTRRIALDGFLDDRHYIAPPGETGSILLVDRETSVRGTVKADEKIGNVQLQGQSWVHSLDRRSRFFADAAFTDQLQFEELSAMRVGGMALATAPIARDFRWAASAVFNRESARVETMGGQVSEGDVTVTELALDGQYERKQFRVDIAGGIAIPTGVGADPWPETKAVAKYKPHHDLEVTGTLGYKGRVPTLRERFDLATGNPKLGPEFARHAEIRVIWEGLRTSALADDPKPRVHVEVAPYTRKTHGTARVCPSQEQCPDDTVGKLAALDDTFFYGVDFQARVKLTREVEIGGSYNYVKACELDSRMGCDVDATMMGGADPLDRLPRNRADAWVQVMPHKRLGALARARYFGGSFDKGIRTETYKLVEANLTAQISKEYLGVLRVDDALDVRPETRTGFRTAGRVVSVVFQGTWQ